MNTITLTDEELLLITDIIYRAFEDFDEPVYDDTIEGYAACSMLQMSYRVKKLLNTVSDQSTKPIAFDESTQRLEFLPEIDAKKGSIK